MFKFKRGETVRDIVTGFEGVIVSRLDFISGCNRYLVQPRLKETDAGKLPEAVYIDEPALERLQVAQIRLNQPVEPPG